jgi:hypothetical protein
MVTKKILILSVFTVVIAYLACKKPFNPESLQGFKSALVVEGVINSSGVTNIYLTRSLDLDDKIAVKPELKATVQVLSENNTAVNLVEKGGGLYSIPQLTLNSTQKYRLKIRTLAGSEYLSDPMAIKITPPIDNLAWTREADGVGIYADAHDSQNNTRYYQWDFEEDWELRSIAGSIYKATAIPGSKARIDPRDPKETPLMFTCYKSDRSTNINIFSTNTLKSDIVSKHPVAFIPNNSEKLGVRYSILVKQYAISFEAFEYLSMMRKNSEQLGSFFDAQPSELIGNIKNVNDPNDIAIGFMGISSIQEKRIFIKREEIPNWGFRLSCTDLVIRNNADSLSIYLSGLYIPLNPVVVLGNITHWEGTSVNCADCRSRQGNNTKPAFW